MNQGYVVNDGNEYFCSDEYLHSEYTKAEWEEMTKTNDDDDDDLFQAMSNHSESYYTDWNEIHYELIDGILVEIDE